ncbi:MAG: hypothetical protein PHT71_02915 [Victivallaceae bacterium]|nr:hypothetical protein [Victivallaceae bacterium]
MKYIAKIRKSYYTLLEIISAMAIFMIICLVVMRFFTGARELVTASNTSNEMYANVRAFFDIIGNDLRSIVYNNKVSKDGIYPFVNAYYPISTGSTFSDSDYKANIEKFYDESLVPLRFKSDLVFKTDFRDYVPLLCFMANPSIIPSDNTSPLCEIRYTFTPVGTTSGHKAQFTSRKETSGNPTQTTEFSGGKILRSVTYANASKTATSTTNPFNAESFPVVDSSGEAVPTTTKDRIARVFADSSSFAFEELIGNVYRMNISCYKMELGTGGIYRYAKLKIFDLAGSERIEFSGDYAPYMVWPPLKDPTDSDSGNLYTYPTTAGGDIELPQLGHPLPDLIKIDLYVLSPRDWNLLMSYYNWDTHKFNDEVAAKRLLDRKLRHFSRTFHINNVDVSNL